MDGNFGNAMTSSSQPRNRLENRGSKDNEMPRRMQEAMEARTGEVRMVEAKRREG